MKPFFVVQAQESGKEAARQAVIQERQKELVSGLQQEHHVQAAAMERQAKAAAQQVINFPFNEHPSGIAAILAEHNVGQ